MNCTSSCEYYRHEIQYSLVSDKSLVKKDFCLLAYVSCTSLTYCPNRDGIASNDAVMCESCGKIIASQDSYFRRYDALIARWYGECSSCTSKRRRNESLKHSCVDNSNQYGSCTVCGTVLPGTALDKL